MRSEREKIALFPWCSVVVLSAILCIFVFMYERYALGDAREKLDRHALVVADALWNFNSAGVVEYMRLAADADNYRSMKILTKDGRTFQEVTGEPSGTLERLAVSLRLLPRVDLSTPVWKQGEVLGWVRVMWIPTTAVAHGAVFTLLLFVQVVIALYCRILRQKLQLGERVTERTAELSAANTLLKKEIHERNLAEKQREELQQSLERSKKMETLGLLAGGVAHDLNNVLSGIVSYPDLLLHDMAADHPLRPVIVTIRDSGIRAAQIVQDLLTLARRGVVSRQPLDLNGLVGEYCSSPEYRKLLESSAPLHVELDLGGELPLVSGSAVGLKKVLMNLVTNAAEAQPQGGSIVISTRSVTFDVPRQGFQQLAAGEYVVLAVADRGEGIGAEDRQRIFEPFYTKKVMGRSGTGLGLTVVWGTVEDHGGAIDLDSQPGQGTTISVYLPVCREEREPGAGDGGKRRQFQGSGEAILVVDDLPHQRDIACAMLRRLNYRPLAVASGEEALSLLGERQVDLVLLDMIMDGGIDGLDTYRGIIDLHPQQKAIIASGYSESDRVSEAQILGAGPCLKKPYTFDELAEAVYRQLHQTAETSAA